MFAGQKDAGLAETGGVTEPTCCRITGSDVALTTRRGIQTTLEGLESDSWFMNFFPHLEEVQLPRATVVRLWLALISIPQPLINHGSGLLLERASQGYLKTSQAQAEAQVRQSIDCLSGSPCGIEQGRSMDPSSSGWNVRKRDHLQNDGSKGTLQARGQRAAQGDSDELGIGEAKR